MPSDPPPIQIPAWQTTWLWTALEKRVASGKSPHASKIRNVTERWVTEMEKVLSKGDTSPLDFTLHDAEHAFRVAARMDYLLTEEIRENLSDYELALLLLAAYGHDIGMTPERGKVTAHHRHLFDPEHSKLTPEEQIAFQTYLDEYDGQTVTLPLNTSAIADLNLADELITFYVRKRHNDWSADWLRENLSGQDEFGSLQDAVSTLILLCTSHHLDVHRLGSDTFKPTFTAGASPQIIHLRYLCCLLRLADILENDPERTPAVVMRHRSLQDREKSFVHWEKDHSLAVCLKGDRLDFFARPHSAVAHRALLELKEWIDHELHGIASFGESLPVVSNIDNVMIRREWVLAPAVTHDIRPADDSYEYIDGAFRPDTARLLQLLSGEQLYGDPFHAVRELLQNAFDAVREKIARKRLHQRNPADPKLEETFGNLEEVILTLRPDSHGGWQLVCEDTGVGLTRDIINHHVLVSGTGRRHAILQLERDCEAKGFHTGLTGQFGIGVLSYFMLADEITLETTRYQGCGNGEESWHFTTRGVGSFGELKKLKKPDTFPDGGTRITWGLRKDRVENIESFAENLSSYIQTTLIRLPCQFEFRIEGLPLKAQKLQRSCGWARTADDWKTMAQNRWQHADNFYQDDYSFLGKSDRQRIEQFKHDHSTSLEFVTSRLRCEFYELSLPGAVGMARVVLTYFEFDAGRSLGFFPEHRDQYPFALVGSVVGAWRGMSCEIKTRGRARNRGKITLPPSMADTGISIELDLFGTTEVALNVDRDEVVVEGRDISLWMDTIAEQTIPLILSTLSTGKGDFYSAFNLTSLGRPLSLKSGLGWFHVLGEPPFRALQLPAAALTKSASGIQFLKTAKCETVTILGNHRKHIQIPRSTFQLKVITKTKPAKNTRSQIIAVLWEDQPTNPFPVAFPSEWKSVALLRLGFDAQYHTLDLANHDHPLITLLLPHEIEYILFQHMGSNGYWKELMDIESPAKSALSLLKTALLLANYDDPEDAGWSAFVSEHRDLLDEHWRMVGEELGKDPEELEIRVRNYHRDVILSSKNHSFTSEDSDERPLLPIVTDPNFLLYEVDEDEPQPPAGSPS